MSNVSGYLIVMFSSLLRGLHLQVFRMSNFEANLEMHKVL